MFLQNKYKITPAQFAAKLAEQGGRCPIGGEVLDASSRALRYRVTRVDHNHRTGEFRGVLCHRHNVGLGYFGDDPELCWRAGDYLAGLT